MHSRNKFIRRISLSILFAFLVFIVMLISIVLLFLLLVIGIKIGIITTESPGWTWLILFSLVYLFIGFCMSLAVSNKPLHVLKEIIRVTDEIADGDYSVRIQVPPKKKAVFYDLANHFNHMAEELGSVEMLRSDFVNNFSHEFKTPIVSVRGFARALRDDNLTEEERREYLDIIIEESERLSDMAVNVLTLGKVEQQVILSDVKSYDVTEQIRLCILLLENKWSSRNISFDFDCPEYFVSGNEELLKQVWINLLDNAIKFSPDGGMIRIKVREKYAADSGELSGIRSEKRVSDGQTEDTGKTIRNIARVSDRSSAEDEESMLTVSIADEGPGMCEEVCGRIFEKFYQADPSRATKGNGLGLALVKKIIFLHNGNIKVESTVGKGTIMTVELSEG